MPELRDEVSGKAWARLDRAWRNLKAKHKVLGWESRQDFIRWSLSNGFGIGKILTREDPHAPHGPENSFWRAPQFDASAVDREQVLRWNRTVNRFRRRAGLPLFPEK